MSKIERIVRKKRDGGDWSQQEIEFIVSSIHKDEISHNIVGNLVL